MALIDSFCPTAVYEVGAFFGAVATFFIGDRLGRLKMIFIGAVLMIIGTIISTTSFGQQNPVCWCVEDPSCPFDVTSCDSEYHWGFGQFIISRVVSGIGTGMLTATIPSWMAECSKAHNRGFLICIEASTVAVGTMIAYWVNYGCSKVDYPEVSLTPKEDFPGNPSIDPSFSWRFPIALQSLFALLVIWGVFVMPQSPRWLLSHGYDEEGLKVVAALAGVPIDHPAALEQRRMILESVNASLMQKSSMKDLLKGGKKQNLRRMIIGASTQVHQQLGGCNAVIYYATILFEDQISLDRELSLILGGVLSVVYALFALTSFLTVERVGRRPLFLIGTAGQAVAMYITWACLLAAQYQDTDDQRAQVAKGGAFGLYFFIAFFGATLLPLPWLYPAELNAQAVRTQANAVSTMCNWLFNFLVVQVLPTMTTSINSWTFFLFAIENTIAFPLIWIFYPETTQRSLTDIDLIFARAHLQNRRPTLVAEEMPPLTANQQQAMLDKYDINGPEDEEHGGVGRDNVDLTIPEDRPPVTDEKHVHSANSTRVPSEQESPRH